MTATHYEKRRDGKLQKRFQAPDGAVPDIDAVLERFCFSFRAGKAKSVLVWGPIDKTAYQRRIDKCGAKPITGGSFPSAKAASRHFGYHYNAVAQELHKAAERGEQTAVVGGVPVRYADSVSSN